MAEHPEIPDVIGLVREWFLDHLDVPVTVAMTKQDDEVSKRHPTFVRLDLLGGADATRVSARPRLAIDAWADSSKAAHDLAQEALATLRHLPDDGGPIYKVVVASLPADLPDPLSEQPRFTFQVEVHVRGVAHTLSGS